MHDHKINRIYSPRSCIDNPKVDKIPKNSNINFQNLDLGKLNKSSAYNLKSQPKVVSSTIENSRTSDEIINVVLQEPHIKM